MRPSSADILFLLLAGLKASGRKIEPLPENLLYELAVDALDYECED